MSASAHEVEIKLRLAGAAHGRRLLRRQGYRVSRRRIFESNVVYDTSRSDLRKSGRLLRVRRAGRDAVLTFKSAPIPARHKTRRELETSLSAPGALHQILAELGYRPVFVYEKYRTEYEREREPGVVTLDETPIGAFLELEGPPRWIDSTAARLGFGPEDYILLSYGGLYLAWCRQEGIAPGQMVFPA
jgi:adenylate cyclase class 2